ncbi:MAG: hypothetical protein Q4G58_14670 [bacterium]|nr:hypothetical protein [bacterium]
MGQEINIEISNIRMLNDTNELNVEVNLGPLWEQIKEYEYIYVIVRASIPIIENAINKIIYIAIRQELKVSELVEESKEVELHTEFSGTVDTAKEATATSSLIGYDKG